MTPQQIEMALETIALVLENLKKTQEKQQATITALEKALAEHAMQEVQRLGQEIEQEPVAWRNAAIRVGEDLSSVGPDGYYDMTAQQWLDWAMEQQPHGKNSLAQTEQEPVAYYLPHKGFYWAKPTSISAPTIADVEPLPLYTAPLQRTWVGLTLEQYVAINQSCVTVDQAICSTERQLKENNT